MYSRVICDFQKDKAKPNQGVDRINYPHICSMLEANSLMAKLLIKCRINMRCNVSAIRHKQFQPQHSMEEIWISMAKNEWVAWRHHCPLSPDWQGNGRLYVYGKIHKGMYGLPQAGLLAKELLETCLKKHDYWQSMISPGFWQHDKRPIQFTIVFDNFKVKYVGKENANHMISIINNHFEMSINMEGKSTLVSP